MKLALILPLLFGGITGVLSYDKYLDGIEQSTTMNSVQDFNNSITAYIDGENKVYLNDINDSSIVEDTWERDEFKTLRLNLDFSNLSSGAKYLDVTLPLGMKFNFSPNVLVDNKIVLSVDTSKFKPKTITLYNGAVYEPECGKIRYYISESASIINLDMVVSVDNNLWDDKSLYASNSTENAITVTIGDDSTAVSKKIDRIKVAPKNFNPNISIDIKNINLNEKVYVKQQLSLNPNKNILKDVSIEFEKPYIEVETNLGVEKRYLNFETKGLTDGGKIETIDNNLILSFKNVRSSYFIFEYYITANENDFKEGDIVNINFKNIKGTSYIKDTEFVIMDDKSFNLGILPKIESEDVNIGTLNHGVYTNHNLNNVLNVVSTYFIDNYGIDSTNKKLEFNFPTDGIAVKGVTLSYTNLKDEYYIKSVLYNTLSSEEVEVFFNINRTTKGSELLTVNKIIELSGLDINDKDNLYIKSIEYDIGVLPKNYKTDYKRIYGRIINENITSSSSIYSIIDLNNPDTINVSASGKSNIQKVGTVPFGVASKVLNENEEDIISVRAGDSFLINTTFASSTWPYNNVNAIANPKIFLKLPRGISLDEHKSKIILYNNSIEENLSFDIVNKSNPKVFDDGDLGYILNIENKGKIIGRFTEDISLFNDLKVSLFFNIEKYVKTQVFCVEERVFLSDEYIHMRDGVRDVLDFDDDGENEFIRPMVAYLGSIKLSILSNESWLNVDNSVENEVGLVDKYKQEITENSKRLRYGLNIDNNNEGVVEVGNSEYYIPIPKRGLEYNTYVKPDGVDFNFDMELASIPASIEKYKVMYSYNNTDYFDHTDDIDITRVSMVKIINTEEILQGDNYNFYVDIKYRDDSWNKTSNSNSWSAYGIQTYTKNGSDSMYIHVFDPLKVELKFEPKIIKNPKDSSVNIGETATFSSEFDLGAPIANTKWQYKKPNTSQWIDLLETDEELVLQNVSISMDGYEYRYVASNDVSTIESQPATLRVTDVSSPVVELIEIKEGDSYKIQINVTDVDNGVSHIILPDGTRINSDTYIIDAIPNTKYIFKAYDLAGNETISEITILTRLTPGTVSSNLDVYIKSKNMLSLSLNTNSIVFDNYSGVEDVEMLSAIELTVSSSLPYKVSAYLPTEIQNADKSNTINKDILNIKENSETTYQRFTNSIDKIVLKDNCIRGNGLIHNIDLKLSSNQAHKADVYKTVIKFEAEQK